MGGRRIDRHRLQPLPEAIPTLGFVLVLALLLPGAVVALLDGVRGSMPGWGVAHDRIALLITPALLIVLAWVRMRQVDTWRTLFVKERGAWAHHVAIGVAVGVAGYVSNVMFAHFSLEVFRQLLGPEAAQMLFESEQRRAADLVTGGTLSGAMLVLLLAVVTPIAEELFFRGYVYRTFRHHWTAPVAVTLSALVFAGFHFYFIQTLPIFVAGIIFAIIYEQTGTLIAPIVAHGVVNGIVVALMLAYA